MKYYNSSTLPEATEKPTREDWLKGFKENRQYLQLNPEKPLYATVIDGEYTGEMIQVLGYYDCITTLKDSGVRWWYTESIPNYYTMMYQMWFKSDELDFS